MNDLDVFLSVRALASLVISPVYIAIVYLAEIKWGQAVSGRLTAVPTQTSTIILIVAVSSGTASAAVVASGAILGVISLSAFAIGYGLAARDSSLGWPTIVGIAAFFASAAILVEFHGTRIDNALAAIAIVLVSVAVLRRIQSGGVAGGKGKVGVPVRMGLALLLIVSVVALVPVFGPVAAGTLGVFPVITAPMTVLNHRDSGPPAARSYLEGLEWGLVGAVLFFLILSALLGQRGILTAFLVGIPVLVAAQLAAYYLPRRVATFDAGT